MLALLNCDVIPDLYVADPAVHGSSMLNESRVGQSVDATWDVVLGYLEEALDSDK